MTVIDDSPYYPSGLTAPFDHAAAVTPAATGSLTHVTRALWIGTAGDLTVVTRGGETVTFTGIYGWVPGRFTDVMAATTAANITAVW